MRFGIKVKINKSMRALKKNYILILQICLLVLISILHAIPAGEYANFYPINGTFQNYNPVRRLLAGQVPYKDFQDYLGMGHLYFGSIVTALFGGDYQGSLQAFSLLSFSGLVIIVMVITFSIIRNKECSLAITNIIFLLLLVKPLFLENSLVGMVEIKDALDCALTVGNSARFIRGMILPLSCALLLVGYEIYSKNLGCKINRKCTKDLIIYGGIGAVAGISFVWSNDYGISTWLCLLLFGAWIKISHDRSWSQTVLVGLFSFLCSLVSIVVVAGLLTKGHLGGWIKSFIGTGGYQSWYYNSKKSYFLYDVDFSFLGLIQLGLVFIYLWKVFEYRASVESIKRYGILAFMNMTCFCAANEYKLISGNLLKEVALSVLFINIIIEIIAWFENIVTKADFRKTVMSVSIVLGLSWTIATAKDEIPALFIAPHSGVYINKMGGYLTDLAGDLIDTHYFLEGNKVWSTYASGQEVLEDKFQPSGIDYIIHVLGDKNRSDYLNKFQDGGFKYVATIRKDYADWEYWAENANWFFYRELYEKWHPVYANAYELYWQKNDETTTNKATSGYQVDIINVSDSTKKIVINCDDDIEGVADVFIDYEVKKSGGVLSKFVYQTNVFVENSGTLFASEPFYETEYLRNKSAEYIPIHIFNGHGEITITSKPNICTSLIVNNVTCDGVYTVMSEYLIADHIVNIDGKCNIVFKKTTYNQNRISGISRIEFNDLSYDVESITTDTEDAQGGWIYVAINGNPTLGGLYQTKVIRILD